MLDFEPKAQHKRKLPVGDEDPEVAVLSVVLLDKDKGAVRVAATFNDLQEPQEPEIPAISWVIQSDATP